MSSSHATSNVNSVRRGLNANVNKILTILTTLVSLLGFGSFGYRGMLLEFVEDLFSGTRRLVGWE